MLWPFALPDVLGRVTRSLTGAGAGDARSVAPPSSIARPPYRALPAPMLDAATAAAARTGGVWRDGREGLRVTVAQLLELSRLLMSELDPHRVYATVPRVVHQALGATRVSLQLLEETGNGLVLVAAQGLPPGVAIGQTTPREQGLAGWVLHYRQPLLVVGGTHPDPAVQQLLRHATELAALPAEAVQSALCVPLVAEGQPLGVLSASTFDAAHPFTADDLDFLSLLAGQVALAVANARLHARVAQLATRDPLTGLLNHRTFHERLDAEIERAARVGGEVALLLLDLDGFKAVNDTHGHPVGDRLLQLVAREALEYVVRPYDTAARLGGDEFAVLLPQSTLADAQRIGERVRCAVQALDYCAHDLPAGLVTASVGLAHFPGDALTGPALLEAADRGLYRAKSLGRNRLERATTGRARLEALPRVPAAPIAAVLPVTPLARAVAAS